MIDGFYTAYMTGRGGNGLGIFVLKDGKIVGADASGGQFDGSYHLTDDGEYAKGSLAIRLAPFAQTIQGGQLDQSGQYMTEITIPIKRLDDFFRLDTPLGPVNVKLQKIREL